MTAPRIRPRGGLRAVYVLALCLPLAAAASGAAPAPVRWTPPTLASDGYESSPSFSPDGDEIVFMRSDRNFARWRLLRSRCERGRWSPPRPPPFASAEAGVDADPAFSPDGRRLYFVSSRHDPRREDLDIYVVERRGRAGWSAPRRLPAPVNSPASELLPRPTGDGGLYFGSSRDGGHGQGDLYLARADAGGRWTVANLGPPLSSAANEYEADVSSDGRRLVAVIDRGDRSHLYRFERERGVWRERGRLPAREDVFQVGPLLSPAGDRLLFAQADGERSGELFLLDLVEAPDRRWPPACGAAPARPREGRD